MSLVAVLRRRTALLAALVVFALAAVLLGVGLSHESTPAAALPVAGDQHEHGTTIKTPAQLAFHDQMRKLWEDHVTWTRLAIVTFAAGTSGFDTAATRLLQNQDDIGTFRPYYGAANATRLSALLHDHITIAVEILPAARAGDSAAVSDASAHWYANANDIADFWASINPCLWPDAVMRADLKAHLDQTLAEAVDDLNGNFAAGVAEYEVVHLHILAMADMLGNGIIDQFPKALR